MRGPKLDDVTTEPPLPGETVSLTGTTGTSNTETRLLVGTGEG